MTSIETLTVDLVIDPEDYRRYYEGAARSVVARALDGRTVRFPASLLRPFLLADGIHGRFRIRCDAAGKLVSIDRLS